MSPSHKHSHVSLEESTGFFGQIRIVVNPGVSKSLGFYACFRMIITTWTAFVLFYKAARLPFPPDKTPDDAVEHEVVPVLVHWLKRVEKEAANVYRQKSENRVDNEVGFRQDIRMFPSLSQDLAAARSKPEPWESFEDRRPPKDGTRLSNTELTSCSSQDLSDYRTNLQFIRWSQTRVYRVTSDMRKDAMQERLNKVTKSVSRVMFQATIDGDITQSDTDLHTSMSTS